jgi:retinoid hydroxylase
MIRIAAGADLRRTILPELFEQYGPVVNLSFGTWPPLVWLFKQMVGTDASPWVALYGREAAKLVTTAAPETIERGPIARDDFTSLAAIDGKVHMDRRRAFVSSFARSQIRQIIPTVVECIRAQIRGWDKEIELHPRMNELTFTLLCRSALGLSPEQAEKLREDYWMMRRNERVKRGTPLYKGAKERVWALLRRQIEDRQREAGNDILSLIIRNVEKFSKTFRVEDQEFADHTYMLIEFGQSDLAVLLTYCLAALAEHGELAKRVRDEAEAYSKATLGNVDAELPFTSAFIREVCRFYPPVASLFRRVSQDTEFQGYVLKQGTFLIESVYATHRDATCFDQPEVFDPDRFLPPRQEHRQNPSAFHPFGAGFHTCVANHFSTAIVAACIHEVLGAYSLRLPPGVRIPPVDYRGDFQCPLRPIHLLVEPS